MEPEHFDEPEGVPVIGLVDGEPVVTHYLLIELPRFSEPLVGVPRKREG